MTYVRMVFLALVLVVATSLPLHQAPAATAHDLDRDSQEALQKLYRTNPLAEDLSHKAQAVLVFPNIIKGGLIFGGSYGEGELLRDAKVASYYNTVSGSWGLQAGAQSYGYVVFLMTDKAVGYLSKTQGWEVGVDPTVVVVDAGMAKNLSSSTMKKDAYAFVFGQQGLMAGVSLEGSKISKIDR